MSGSRPDNCGECSHQNDGICLMLMSVVDNLDERAKWCPLDDAGEEEAIEG